MATVRQRASGSWQVIVQVRQPNGRRRQVVALAALTVAGVALAATTAHQRAHRTARFAQQLNAYKRHTDQHTIHTNGQGPRRP